MSLSSAEIGAVLAEIRPRLVGGWIQKVFQPSDYGVVLEIRTPGRTLDLNISVHPEAARLHVQRTRVPNLPQPPAFCQLLRSRLHGARIEDIRQIEQDRIVDIRLRAKDTPFSLIAELTGRGANLLLIDADARVLATLRPARDRLHSTIGPRPHHEPHRSREQQSRFRMESPDGSEEEFLVSRAVEAHYRHRERDAIVASAREQRAVVLRRTAKKLTRRIEALQRDLERAGRYESYARYGELLKANLDRVRKGATQATVIDYFDESLPTLSLPLDPARSPQGNMDDYFQKYRKYLAAQRQIGPRVTATQAELAHVRKELASIEEGTWSPPGAVAHPGRAAADGLGQDRRAERKPARTGPFRRFRSRDDLPIYVGRTAQENEMLTHRFANSEDLWLHARGVPGSHVVVRLPKGTEVPPETLRDAATLALLYSDLKKSGKGEVIYTRKKWVRKAKGQAAGSVVVTQDKSIFVQLDRDRLERLKGNEERPG